MTSATVRYMRSALLGEFLVQLTILFVGAAIGSHHLRPYQALRRDHIVQVMFQRPFQYKPLRLPVLLSHRNEFFVQFGVNLGGDFDGSRHGYFFSQILAAPDW